MNDENQKRLEQEIEGDFEILSKIEFGSDDYKMGVDCLTKLIDKAIELKKSNDEPILKLDLAKQEFESKLKQLEIDNNNKIAQIELEHNNKIIEMEKDASEKRTLANAENNLKKQQLINDKKDKFIANAITIGSILTNTALIVWGTIVTIKFEKTDTMTSTAGRSFFGKPFKLLK